MNFRDVLIGVGIGIFGMICLSTALSSINNLNVSITDVPFVEAQSVEQEVERQLVKAQTAEAQKIEVPIEKKEGILNYAEFNYFTVRKIGDFSRAPTNYSYVVATVHIKNTGKQIYSTNPFYWHVIVDGITYDADVATFSQYIDHQTVEVGPSGEVKTQFVFLVQGEPPELTLSYDGPGQF